MINYYTTSSVYFKSYLMELPVCLKDLKYRVNKREVFPNYSTTLHYCKSSSQTAKFIQTDCAKLEKHEIVAVYKLSNRVVGIRIWLWHCGSLSRYTRETHINHRPFAAAQEDNAEFALSSLIESSLSMKDIIENVNRKLDGLSRSLSRAVYTMCNSVLPVISWTLRRGLR